MFIFIVDQFVGTTAPAVHMAETVGYTPVAKHPRYLIESLVPECEEIPARVEVLQICLRVALLGVDERHEHKRVPNEEDRGIIANQIPVTLFCVELDGEPSRVAHSVSTASFASDCWKTDGHWRSLTKAIEQVRFAVFLNLLA